MRSAPPSANITPAANQGIGNWDEADFFRALHSYTRPDASEISKGMPEFAGKMSDEELKALWLYLQSIAPVAQAGKTVKDKKSQSYPSLPLFSFFPNPSSPGR